MNSLNEENIKSQIITSKNHLVYLYYIFLPRFIVSNMNSI